MPPHNIATEPGSVPDGMEVIADDDAKAVFSVLLIWGRDSTRNVLGQFWFGIHHHFLDRLLRGEWKHCAEQAASADSWVVNSRWAGTLMIQIQTVIFHSKILSSLYSTKHAGTLPRSWGTPTGARGHQHTGFCGIPSNVTGRWRPKYREHKTS